MKSDDELMAQITTGSNKAFEELYSRHCKIVYGYLFKFLSGNQQTVDDVAQQTWLKVIEKSKLYKPNGYFKAWVLKISRNLAIDYFRKNKKLIFSDFIDETIADDINLQLDFERKEQLITLEELINKLPESQKTIILMQITEGLSYQEIAKQLYMNPNQVKCILYRAKKTIKEEIRHEPALA